jgi:hypothetical protein
MGGLSETLTTWKSTFCPVTGVLSDETALVTDGEEAEQPHKRNTVMQTGINFFNDPSGIVL